MRRAVPAMLLAAALVPMSAAAAQAAPGGGHDSARGPTKPWVSNMGFCSAQLGQAPGVMGLAPTARAEVNQIIRLYGDSLGIAHPGALYSVRARTSVAQDGVCQRR